MTNAQFYFIIIKANFNRKTDSSEIRKFNEDFVAFASSEFLKQFGFKILTKEQENTLNEEDILTLLIFNPKSKFWKNSQELKEFYSWANIADKKLINRLAKLNDEVETF